METLWFCLVAIMIAGYVVLDGFDLGTGIVHFCIGRTESQRRRVLRAIGPVWDGNEVWLLAEEARSTSPSPACTHLRSAGSICRS